MSISAPNAQRRALPSELTAVLRSVLPSVLALGLGALASGCLSEVTVLDAEDGGTGGAPQGMAAQFGNAGAGAGASGGAAFMGVEPADSPDASSLWPPLPGAAGDEQTEPPAPEITVTCGSGPPIHSGRCAGDPGSDPAEVLITELNDVYDLSVTTDDLYAATWGGIFRVPRAGGTQEEVVDEFATRVLADDQRFYWNASSSELYLQGDDGERSVFVPTHSSIDGLTQDEDAIFALTDGYVLRIAKDTGDAETLVGGTTAETALDGSLALDDAHVYFWSYGKGLALERVGKDGEGRELLATGLAGPMEQQALLVDDSHVYAADIAGRLQRIPLDGGEPQQLARIADIRSFPDGIMVQDAACLYYSDGPNIYCLSKAECTTELVYTADEGAITALAMQGTELYFGVTVDSPAAAPKGWVGSLRCAAGD